MKKSSFLTFCFALVPGAGQMYLGYMHRGLSFIALFCFNILGAAVFSYFMALMPIIWMYSFFDTFNLRNQLAAGSARPDAFLLPDELVHRGAALIQHSPRLIGGGLILLGAWMMLDNTLMPLLRSLADQFEMYWIYDVIRDIPSLLVAAVIIFVGFKMAFGSKRQPQDFDAYRGGGDE